MLKFFSASALALACVFSLNSCDDDDESVTSSSSDSGSYKFVISANIDASGESTTVLLSADTLSSGVINPTGRGTTADDVNLYYNFDDKYLFTMSYAVTKSGTNKSYFLNSDGSLSQRDIEFVGLRWEMYGQCGSHILTASVNNSAESHALNGALPKCFWLNDLAVSDDADVLSSVDTDADYDDYTAENYLGNGEYVMFAAFLQRDNGQIVTPIAPYGLSAYGAALDDGKYVLYPELQSAGSSSSKSSYTTKGEIPYTQHPDECWVAFYDNIDLKNSHRTKLIKSDKISFAMGRTVQGVNGKIGRTFYLTSFLADNGDIYLFSPSYNKSFAGTTYDAIKGSTPAGVVRIKNGEEDFDDSFYCNLEALTGGLSFKQVSYLGGSKFLLQIYEEPFGDANFSGDALTLAIYDADSNSLSYVTGLPDKSLLTSVGNCMRQILVLDGKAFVDVATTDSNPAVYLIDVQSASATKGATVLASSINAITRMKF